MQCQNACSSISFVAFKQKGENIGFIYRDISFNAVHVLKFEA